MKLMYGVYNFDDDKNPLLGIYPTHAEAEEIVLADCEEWAYYIMMTASPWDVFGHSSWDWAPDYRDLLASASEVLRIVQTPVFEE